MTDAQTVEDVVGCPILTALWHMRETLTSTVEKATGPRPMAENLGGTPGLHVYGLGNLRPGSHRNDIKCCG